MIFNLLYCPAARAHPLHRRSFKTLLTKDELAGLACCPDVEARVVAGGRYVDNAGKDWEVEHGPFEEQVRWEVLCNWCNVTLGNKYRRALKCMKRNYGVVHTHSRSAVARMPFHCK